MKRTYYGTLVVLAVVLLVTLTGDTYAQSGAGNPLLDEVRWLEPQVLNVYPHDANAFTQGLLFHDGYLYESTGRYGESSVRLVEPASGEVLRSVDVPQEYFGEGLALVGETLIQLTWKSGVAFLYDRETFEPVGQFEYEGEGWGLCTDGRYLYMSDGSPFLDVRDPETFELIFSGLVTVQGSIVQNINELECVGDYVYANVWKTNYILQIDKTNGVTVAVIDASNLLSEDERAALSNQEVLNGIAYRPETDTFWLTGKHWPHIYEVRFVEAERPVGDE